MSRTSLWLRSMAGWGLALMVVCAWATAGAAEPGASSGAGDVLAIRVLPAPCSQPSCMPPPADAPSLECQVSRDLPLPLAALAFSPDGKTLAVGGLGEVVLWDLAEAKLARRIDCGPATAMIQAIAWTKDGNAVVAGYGVPNVSGTVTVLDVKAGKPLAEFAEPKGLVNCLALSPDGKRLVAGCGDAAAYVWSLDEKKLLATLKDHSLPVLSAAFNTDGKFIVTGGADSMVQTWDTQTWQPDLRRTMVGGEVRGCMIRRSQQAKDGKPSHTFALVIGGREDRSVRIVLDGKAQAWQRKSEYHMLIEPGVPLDCAWWQARGSQKAYIACSDGTIKVIADEQRFSHKATLRGHGDWVYAVALSADGAVLASAGGDGTVRLWSTADNRPLATLAQLTPRSDHWLIVARDGWFDAQQPDAVTWKAANLKVPADKLSSLRNADAVRKTLSGNPPAPPF